MQTLLPLPSFKQTASCLSDRDLKQQQIDVCELMDTFHDVEDPKPRGWPIDHPVIDMWIGHEPQLCEYGLEMCEEWKARGHESEHFEQLIWHLECATSGDFLLTKPRWFGDMKFHNSHQSLLLRNNKEHYQQFFPNTSSTIPVVWPKSRDNYDLEKD